MQGTRYFVEQTEAESRLQSHPEVGAFGSKVLVIRRLLGVSTETASLDASGVQEMQFHMHSIDAFFAIIKVSIKTKPNTCINVLSSSISVLSWERTCRRGNIISASCSQTLGRGETLSLKHRPTHSRRSFNSNK